MVFHDLVTFSRISRAAVGDGGQTATFASNAANERVRVRPASTGEREAGGRLDGHVTHVVYCRPGVDVKRSDRITGTNVPTLDVLDVTKPSKRDRFKVCRCEETQTGG